VSRRNSKILIVEDDRVMGETLAKLFGRAGYYATYVSSGKSALGLLEEEPNYAIVITDLVMPEIDGLELLRRIKEKHPGIEVIVMTGYGTIKTAVDAIKQGAFDYITKPFNKDEILEVVSKIFKMKELEQKVSKLEAELSSYRGKKYPIVGRSKPLLSVLDKARAAAQTDVPVLITGESGTGKELVARLIHEQSPRKDGPFVPVNCGALPKDLIESELFGYKKGAFTGAVSDSLGLFRAAEGGTLFLDEIAEMPSEAQAKLLRTIETHSVRPIGGTKEIPVKVRIIAATNKPLERALSEGLLRRDLYYRFVMVINIPPLRERKEDIPLLIEHFSKKFSKIYGVPEKRFHPSAIRRLMECDWLGNVRELENLIEGLYALGSPEEITVQELPPVFSEELSLDHVPYTLEEVEKQAIMRALKRAKGNKSKAASLLGISRSRLYRKLKQYGFE